MDFGVTDSQRVPFANAGRVSPPSTTARSRPEDRMPAENVEAIRGRMTSLLTDAELLRRRARRLGRAAGSDPQPAVEDLRALAARIDCAARELYHLLPEHLRPQGLPRPLNPREPGIGDADKRPHVATPGGPVPREVRWPSLTLEWILQEADAY